jgi:hypothetical protein
MRYVDGGRNTPIGLRLSAVLLAVSGGCAGIFVVVLSTLVIRRWIFGPTLGIALSIWMASALALAVLFSYSCVRTAGALYEGALWAGYATTVFGLLLIALNGWMVIVRVHSPDDYVLPFFTLVGMFIGLCCCVLPLLPASRNYMRELGQRDGNTNASLPSG